MKYFLACLALALTMTAVSPAFAKSGALNLDESFSLSVESRDGARRVVVRYNHPQFGWVDAGYVDFSDDGKITLKIRGEDPETVADLEDRLSSFSELKIGDPSIGQQLAMNIEGAAAGM